jgi:hypothetical protein
VYIGAVSLISNPIGELLGPLQRLEHSIARLTEQLGPISALPAVHDELRDVNATLTLILAELRDQRRR